MLLLDTGWAGTFQAFCRELGERKLSLQMIDMILITHFHPDHMGIAQEIADKGPVILIPELQLNYVHFSDKIFEKEGNREFISVKEESARIITLDESRAVLKEIGIEGEILSTPGHSDDSITLALDDGTLFVGDLNPLYELEMHKGTEIGKSWELLLKRNPKRVFYGHAGPQDGLNPAENKASYTGTPEKDRFTLVKKIMTCIDKGYSFDKIQRKTGADPVFIEDVSRMYLTHQNVGVQGILDRIEIKNR